MSTISVIIPVYNGEKYIENILQAFDRQITEGYELIFVDDGSTDGSYEKISSWVGRKNYPIRVIRQENSGVSAARNTGIRAAKGEYITFVDVDDFVTDDYLALLLDRIEKYAPEVLVFQSIRIREDIPCTVPDNPAPEFLPISSEDILRRFITDPTAFGVYNIVVRRELIDRHDLFFSAGYKYYEDYDYLLRVFSLSRNIEFTERVLYFYLFRSGSAMATFVPDRLSCLSLLKDLEPFIKQNCPAVFPNYEKWMLARINWSIMWQACLAFSIRYSLRFAKKANIRQEMRKLKDFRLKKVRLSSRLFLFSPLLFVLAAKAVGRRRSKLSKSDFSSFEDYFSSLQKKILVYGMTKNIGGIESYIMSVYRNLDKSGLSFDFLVDWDDMAFKEEVKKEGSEIFYIPAKSASLLGHLKGISKVLKEHAEYKTVYFNVMNAGAVISMLPCFLKGRKIVVHSHNSSDANMRLHKFCKIPLNILANEKLACSASAAEHMFGNNAIKKGKVTIVNNAIDAEAFSFSEEGREKKREELALGDAFTVIHIGRMSEEKNPLFVVDIFSSVRSLLPDAVLLYLGRGDMEKDIKNRAKKTGAEKNIRFLGVRNDVSELLKAADAFLLPSRFEGLPISLIEAQAADLPCFVSEEVTRDADITGNIAFLPLSLPPEEWAEKIVAVKTQNKKRRSREEDLQRMGYDIRTEAKKVIDILKRNQAE